MKLLRGWYGDLSPGVRAFFGLFPIFMMGALAVAVLIAAYVGSSFVASIAIPIILCVALLLFGIDVMLSSSVASTREDDFGRYE